MYLSLYSMRVESFVRSAKRSSYVNAAVVRVFGVLLSQIGETRVLIPHDLRDKSFYEHGTASPCCIAWHFDFMKMLFS